MPSVESTTVDAEADINIIDDCPAGEGTDLKRTRKDPTGTGKTWLLGAYRHPGHQEDRAQALEGCPTNYKRNRGLNGSWESENRFSDVSSSVMSNIANGTYEVLHGGRNTSYKGRNASNRVGSWDVNEGDVGWQSSGGDHDYASICVKKDNVYLYTNPHNGAPIGSSLSVPRNVGTNISINTSSNDKKIDAHKDICCGFILGGITSPEDEYCHPEYCDIGNNITQDCRDRLAEKCGEDDYFKKSPYCHLSYDAYITHNNFLRGSARLGRSRAYTVQMHANTISKSLHPEDYKNIGTELCSESDFEPPPQNDKLWKDKSEETKEKILKRDACTLWCSRNPIECRGKLDNFCKDVYDNSVSSTGEAGDRFIRSQKICGCNWPQEFYDNLRSTFVDDFNVPEQFVPNRRICLHKGCKESMIGDLQSEDAIYGTSENACDQMNIVNCVQNMNFNAGDINVADGGTFHFQTSQDANCNLQMQVEDYTRMYNYYAGISPEPPAEEEDPTEINEVNEYLKMGFILNEEGTISSYSIIAIISCIFLCCIFALFLIFFTEEESNCKKGDIKCLLK